MKVFAIALGICLCFSFVSAYTNPLEKTVRVRAAELSDYVRDEVRLNSDVFTINTIKKDEECLLYTTDPSYAKCALDLVCMPTNPSACALARMNNTKTQEADCTGTCQPLQGEDGVCHSQYFDFCDSEHGCNMNTNGMNGVGTCTKFFSLSAGEIASEVEFCKYGLVKGVERTESPSQYYDLRTLQKCVEVSVMPCNKTLVVGQYGCSLSATPTELNLTSYSSFHSSFDEQFFSCKPSTEEVTIICEFLASDCESEMKAWHRFNRQFNSGLGQRSSVGCHSTSCLNRRHELLQNLMVCFDKLNYDGSNPIETFQSAAATHVLSVALFLVSLLLAFF